MSREAQQQKDEEEMEVCGASEGLAPLSLGVYETQFFGFTPQTFLLRVCGAFQDNLSRMLEMVEELCVRQQKRRGASDQELLQTQAMARENTREMQQLMDQKLEKMWDKMEAKLLSHCLTIPPNVLLPEDESQREHPQDLEELLRLESSIAKLQKSYEAEVCARQALLAELEEQKEVQKQLNENRKLISDLQAIWAKEGDGNLHRSLRLGMESEKILQEAVRKVDICKSQKLK